MKKSILMAITTVVMVCSFSVASASNLFTGKAAYLQLSTGMSFVDWKDFKSGQTWTMNDNAEGGLGFGGLFGMSFYKNISAEAGFLYLPKVQYTQASTKFDITQFLAYAASRLTLKVSENVALFTRLGLGYRSFDNSQASFGSSSLVAPVFGVGMNYFFSPRLWAGLSYTHQPGRFTGDITERAPNLNQYDISLMYRFTA